MTPRFLFIAALAVLACATPACKKKGAGRNDVTYTGSDSDRVNGTPLGERQEGVSFLDPSVSKSRFARCISRSTASKLIPPTPARCGR